MSFLSAAFLLALPLAAVPVVLHLLKKRQQEVISWGAMEFLTDAASEGRRFDRIEEWLLLALRTLAVLALVFALAQPLVRPWAGGSAVGREIVLVLDDSLSTDRQAAGGTLFEAIRQRALDVIDEQTDSESVRVMLAAEGPRWLTDEAIQTTPAGKRELRRAIESCEPTGGAANLLGCLRVAASYESGDEGLDRSILVFADNQAHGWQAAATGAWKRLGSLIENADRQTSLQVVLIDSESAPGFNLAVTKVEAAQRVVLDGEPTTLRATVANTGEEDSYLAKLNWSVDGNPIGTSDLGVIAPGGKRVVEWTTTFKGPRPHEVLATSRATDLLSLDNQAGRVVEVVKAIPVLVVTPDDDPQEQAVAFLAAALGAEPDEGDESLPEGWRSPFAPKFVAFDQLADESLATYRTVVLSSVSDAPESLVESLETYVRDGGGLWLMLGPRIDRERFNRLWLRGGAGLCPAPLASLVRPDNRDDAEASIHPPENDHPATAMLSDTARLDIDRVRLRRYHGFRRAAGDKLTPLLESGRGAPLALLNPVGRGRVIVQAFPLRSDWTDLVIAKSFVVLVQDWLAYLSQPAATRFNVLPRETIEYRVALSEEGEPAEARTPLGETSTIEPVQRAGAWSYRVADTRLPGRYQLRIKESTKPFRVTRHAEESELSPLSEYDRQAIAEASGVRFANRLEAAVAPATSETRPRQEPVWAPLLIAMVCFMAGESLLSTRLSRGRYGQSAV